MWVYGQGTMDIKFTYLKKPYQSTSTSIQYCIFLLLEKADSLNSQLTVEEITGKLVGNPSIVLNEVSGLLFNVNFNPKKELNCGIISTDLKKDEEMGLKTKVWLNKDFSANALKISTIPQVMKVSNFALSLYIYFLYSP